ncbi:HAD family hydrolase [Paramicrobacterium chengjingii]|uniref:HAD family hydrolase n=1 Tax=Paramicrobacterium chengjingii TaxID=2769067 RepID=UPI00142499D1|nr:HAD family hydrolase [Microbacterium chengjingii]
MALIMFDLDGTLVDQKAAAQMWAAEFADDWNLTVDQAMHLADALDDRRPKDEVFARVISEFSLALTADDAWRAYRNRMPELVRCSDDDKAALDVLRSEGWKLGIVTNGMRDNQEGKIRATGLDRLVDGWAISSVVGARKPDPQIFESMSRQLGEPLSGWVVGDSLEMDVIGGSRVGLNTIWITTDVTELARHDVEPTLIAPTVASAARSIVSNGNGQSGLRNEPI